MDLELKLVVLEILLHLLAIYFVDIIVRYGENTAPPFIALGELRILGVKNAVHKSEVIFDLLVPLNMEAVLRLGNGSIKVRHVVEMSRSLSRVEQSVEEGQLGISKI